MNSLLSGKRASRPISHTPDAKPEHAQRMAGHADPKTMRLYDRRSDAISLDEVERIGI